MAREIRSHVVIAEDGPVAAAIGDHLEDDGHRLVGDRPPDRRGDAGAVGECNEGGVDGLDGEREFCADSRHGHHQ